MGNSVLGKAKSAKQDEFYTQLSDVEQELSHYRDHFFGKVIYLNCDDPDWSSFWLYFSYNFDFFGLKKLISTHYEEDGSSSYMLMLEEQYNINQPNIVKKKLKGNGDFRSDECIELLKKADIVVTNPPFSLFHEYISQLMEYEKSFIILGNQNAFTYKGIFPLLKENKVWTGYKNGDMAFRVPDYYPERETRFWIDDKGQKWRSLGNICWFTNLEIGKRNNEIVLTEFYEGNEENYPKYDNYDAIEVSRVKEIPMDYKGFMGVPITFFNNHNPAQFEIKGASESEGVGFSDGLFIQNQNFPAQPLINGVRKYKRIFIRNKKPISKREMLGF